MKVRKYVPGMTPLYTFTPTSEDVRPGTVNIMRWLEVPQEADEEVGPMYKVRYLDGTVADAYEDELEPQGFNVEIAGEYGEVEGSIHLCVGGEELVMWDSNEWVEDPSLVYVIANAITIGFTQGATAISLPSGIPFPPR